MSPLRGTWSSPVYINPKLYNRALIQALVVTQSTCRVAEVFWIFFSYSFILMISFRSWSSHSQHRGHMVHTMCYLSDYLHSYFCVSGPDCYCELYFQIVLSDVICHISFICLFIFRSWSLIQISSLFAVNLYF